MFDYLGQRKEELGTEGGSGGRDGLKELTVVVQAPTPNAGGASSALRTTYNPAPYDPAANPNQGGWASAKSPYGFNAPQTGQVAGGRV